MMKKKTTKVRAASRAKAVKGKAAAVRPPSRASGQKAGSKSRAAVSVPVVAAVPKIRIPRQYRSIYEALVRLRERMTRQINFLATDNLTRTQDDTEVDFRSKEQGTDNFDRDFALTRVSRDQDLIFEIDEALNRIRIGTYGKCENCGRAIERARLASLPYSRMCIRCQATTETSGKQRRNSESGTIYAAPDKISGEADAEDE